MKGAPAGGVVGPVEGLHAGLLRGAHVVEGIVHEQALRGGHAQALAGAQVDARVRFAQAFTRGGDEGVKLGQVHAGGRFARCTRRGAGWGAGRGGRRRNRKGGRGGQIEVQNLSHFVEVGTTLTDCPYLDFQIRLSLKPVASLGSTSSEISSKNSLKILLSVMK